MGCWTLSQKSWGDISEPGVLVGDSAQSTRQLCFIRSSQSPAWNSGLFLAKKWPVPAAGQLPLTGCSSGAMEPIPGHVRGLLVLTLVRGCNRDGMEMRMEMGLGLRLGKGWRQK